MNQLEYTVSEMYRLASEYAEDTKPHRLQNIYQVFDATRRIPFVRDPDGCGVDECLMRPEYTAQRGGDCDDKVIFAGAALTNLGVPFRIVTASYRPDREMQHTYLEIFHNGSWRPFDATYSSNKIFMEKPYTKKLIWENPLTSKTLYGVTSLEGYLGESISPGEAEQWSKLIDFAAAQQGKDSASIMQEIKSASFIAVGAALGTLIPIPIVGTVIGAVIGTLATLIGTKGPTQHLSWEESRDVAAKVAGPVWEIYKKIPDSGKEFMRSAIDKYASAMLGNYGTWWGGLMRQEYNGMEQNENQSFWKDDAWHQWSKVFWPLMSFVRASDVDGLENNFRYVINTYVNPHIVEPTQQFIAEKLKATAEFNLAAGKGTYTPPASSGFSLPQIPAWLYAVAATGLFLAIPKRRK